MYWHGICYLLPNKLPRFSPSCFIVENFLHAHVSWSNPYLFAATALSNENIKRHTQKHMHTLTLSSCMYTYTPVNTYTHTYMNTNICIHMHAHKCMYTHAHVHIPRHKNTCPCSHTYTYTQTHLHMCIFVYCVYKKLYQENMSHFISIKIALSGKTDKQLCCNSLLIEDMNYCLKVAMNLWR